LKGLLIRGIEGEVFFRAYQGETFTDYDIAHPDLFVEILDDDAMIKGEDTDNPVIDVSDKTLGKEIK
jgi:hypothetical protein